MKAGSKLQRKTGSKQILTVIEPAPDGDFYNIQDSNGIYCVPYNKIDTYFDIVENDFELPSLVQKKLDSETKHSISIEMNDPSPIQIQAFKVEE